MKSERYFYTTAAVVMLAITFAGFHPYYLAGQGMGGRRISPELLALVLIHAIALSGWMAVFLVQALLIDTRKRGRARVSRARRPDAACRVPAAPSPLSFSHSRFCFC